MTLEEIKNTLPEIEKDAVYFANIGFEHLRDKFIRDINCIKGLLIAIESKKDE